MTDTVKITLNGVEHTLRPTLKAAIAIDRSFGGMLEAFQSIGKMSFSGYAIIIAAGLDKKPSQIEEDVFASGLESLAEPVSEFLSLLMTGGKKKESAVQTGE